ncbi:FkbM family methyltransferase [Nitrospirillum amazonense]|uniref:FkbM family methyltransferase n=1 Tax=Nitrospirillum amazonense TaxID=28077 RepID=A0A560FSF9_9PROT|nr:FkbM family methyltransferase [Nitrospirillum amazonense]TWB24575.1 FkbM family methyltransferase [Nitrospirillum amazonense]
MLLNTLRKIPKLFSAAPVDTKVVKVGTPRAGFFDFHIHTSNDKYISPELEKDGIWESFETEIFSRLCRPGEFILDIGANIGWYTAIAARLIGPAGRVHAFEPDPANYALLRRNAASPPSKAKVRLFNFAIGDKRQASTLFLSPVNRGDHNLFASRESRQSVTIEVRALDDLLLGCKHLPTLLKSDTQGSEARVLRGARRLLGEGWRPNMILEFWPYGLHGSGDDAGALWRQLDDLGYATFKLLETEPRLTRLRQDDMAYWLGERILVENRGFINLLCLHQSSDQFQVLADLIDD